MPPPPRAPPRGYRHRRGASTQTSYPRTVSARCPHPRRERRGGLSGRGVMAFGLDHLGFCLHPGQPMPDTVQGGRGGRRGQNEALRRAVADAEVARADARGARRPPKPPPTERRRPLPRRRDLAPRFGRRASLSGSPRKGWRPSRPGTPSPPRRKTSARSSPRRRPHGPRRPAAGSRGRGRGPHARGPRRRRRDRDGAPGDDREGLRGRRAQGGEARREVDALVAPLARACPTATSSTRNRSWRSPPTGSPPPRSSRRKSARPRRRAHPRAPRRGAHGGVEAATDRAEHLAAGVQGPGRQARRAYRRGGGPERGGARPRGAPSRVREAPGGPGHPHPPPPSSPPPSSASRSSPP